MMIAAGGVLSAMTMDIEGLIIKPASKDAKGT